MANTSQITLTLAQMKAHKLLYHVVDCYTTKKLVPPDKRGGRGLSFKPWVEVI